MFPTRAAKLGLWALPAYAASFFLIVSAIVLGTAIAFPTALDAAPASPASKG
ncbi:hypothetical protein ACQPZX_34335 [Actinoplanes sp. CA-142083]|uniref:hypothetical protein n=1 Tax=Actinoplanes sp. CA-142083 TaxID=3239903 RepID=UPI003D90CA75